MAVVPDAPVGCPHEEESRPEEHGENGRIKYIGRVAETGINVWKWKIEIQIVNQDEDDPVLM